MRGAWGREMRPMDCLRESYSFTLYAQVTLEELMPCKVANQIAPVISKHSIWFIRIINTGQEKKKVQLNPGYYTVVNQRNTYCTLPLTRLGQVTR